MPRDVILRPRLVAVLDAGAPLTLVRGACGSGKTVALREWAQSAREAVLWITARDEVSSSAALASTIVHRLGDIRHANPDGDSSTEWAAARTALRSFDAPVTIVVDDAAHLDPEALVDLCALIADVPALRVIAAANRRTVLDGDGVDLLLDRTVVGPADLMFDDDEIRTALEVPSRIAAEVRAATNGYPAVIHALARRGISVDGGSLLDSAVEAVEQYMRLRVARAGYDPALIKTLVLVSAADAVDLPLAQALSEDPGAQDALDRAEQYGFGLWSCEDPRPVFRFAPFARALLRRELERAHPDQMPRLRRTMVESSLRNQDPVEALRLALAGDDLRLASRVVASSWHHLISHDGPAVRELLGAVPLARLRQHTLLVTILAICYAGSRVRRMRGLQLFHVAVSAANSQRSDLSASERLFVWSAESVALRLIGMPERAGAVAKRAARLLGKIPEAEREWYASELPLLCAQLGISLYYGGRRDNAVECFEYGAALAETGVKEHSLSSLAMLSGIRALEGDIPEAREYVALLRSRQWPQDRLDGYQGTFYRVAEAIIALEEDDPARAAEHVAFFGPHRATSEHWLTMATVEALVSVRAGRAEAGLAQLESLVALRGREGRSSAARGALAGPRARLHLALGDEKAARAVLRKDATEDRFETLLERGRVALVAGRPAETLRLVSQARPHAKTSRMRADASVLIAAGLAGTGGPSSARREAQTLAALLSDRRLRTPLTLLPSSDLRELQGLFPREASALLSVESALPNADGSPLLTAREHVVLRALPSGAAVPAIAADLRVSPNTVKSQLKSIYRKLGVASRHEAVAVAVAQRLLPEEH